MPDRAHVVNVGSGSGLSRQYLKAITALGDVGVSNYSRFFSYLVLVSGDQMSLEIPGTDVEQATVQTVAQAMNYVDRVIVDMVKARNKCDITFPDNPSLTVAFQRRAMWVFLTKQGEVTGAIHALAAVGLLPDRAVDSYKQQAVEALLPKVVG